MRLIALVFATALPFASLAQSQQIPKPVLDDLARDLSQLQQAVLEAQRKQEAQAAFMAKATFGVAAIMATNPSTVVHAGATDSSATILKVPKGSTFSVLDKAGDWYAVALPSPAQGLKSGWIKAADAVPVSSAAATAISGGTGTGQPAGSFIDPILRDLTDQAAQVKQKWNKNPYVSITGFSINLVPLGLSLNFDFK